MNAPQVTELSRFCAIGTVVDGTFNIWQDRTPLADGTDPVFGPTIAWLPPPTRLRGSASPQATARAQAASATYRRMLKRLYDSGVTLVPGTDNVPGFFAPRRAGGLRASGHPGAGGAADRDHHPARVMKDDKDWRQHAPGKIADLAIVNGRPAERITDLRRTERVIVPDAYDSKALYEAAGLTPKW